MSRAFRFAASRPKRGDIQQYIWSPPRLEKDDETASDAGRAPLSAAFIAFITESTASGAIDIHVLARIAADFPMRRNVGRNDARLEEQCLGQGKPEPFDIGQRDE